MGTEEEEKKEKKGAELSDAEKKMIDDEEFL